MKPLPRAENRHPRLGASEQFVQQSPPRNHRKIHAGKSKRRGQIRDLPVGRFHPNDSNGASFGPGCRHYRNARGDGAALRQRRAAARSSCGCDDPGTQAQEIYYAAPLGGYIYEGKLYGLPIEFNLEYGGAYVNRDMFEAAGLPYPPQWKTWDDVVADAKKLTKFDNTGAMEVAGLHYTNNDQLLHLLPFRHSGARRQLLCRRRQTLQFRYAGSAGGGAENGRYGAERRHCGPGDLQRRKQLGGRFLCPKTDRHCRSWASGLLARRASRIRT